MCFFVFVVVFVLLVVFVLFVCLFFCWLVGWLLGWFAWLVGVQPFLRFPSSRVAVKPPI